MSDDIPTAEEIKKVINANPFIQERRKKRCSCKKRKFIVDLTNREILCEKCGQVIDPFDAMVEITLECEHFDYYLNAMHQKNVELSKWLLNHKEPLALKPFIEKYRNGNKYDMLPYCPHCGKMIEIESLIAWGNRAFLKRNDNKEDGA